MGGCATKPKDLKAEFDKAPEPVPEVVKEETSTVSEPKKVEGEEAKEIGEVVKSSDGGAVEKEDDDDKGSRRKSLNSLLMETEIGKAPVENEKPILSEPVKEVEAPKSEISSESCDAASTETEKNVESAPVVETVKPEISVEKETVEVKEEPAKEDVSLTEKKDSDVVIKKDEPVLPVPSVVEVKEDVAVSK